MVYSNYIQPQNNNMIWVQGETGAKSFLIAPNTTIPLWDSENQTIYIKSSDASGIPSMKIIDYTIRETDTTEEYVKKSDFDELKKMIEELKEGKKDE